MCGLLVSEDISVIYSVEYLNVRSRVEIYVVVASYRFIDNHRQFVIAINSISESFH